MLISLNWIKKYVDIDIDNGELVKLIGSRLVEVEDVIDQTHKYDKIYAVEIKYCEKIPDTHLSLCKIDDGGKATGVERDENGYVQVMCGAPNVRQGMKAAWIAPGAVVPASVHEDAPFVIGVRKMLKKYDSYGMMAGADELDLGDDHTGIVELDPATAQPGDNFADLFELNDIVLDIENKSLTHRPDTFGIIGFAREIAGILGKEFKTPGWYTESEIYFEQDKDIKLNIEIEDNKICPRYTALVLTPHGEKKQKYLNLQDTLLARSGMRSIDPIVDLTNYLMLLSGQPLHAFDYDKFVAVGGSKEPKIIVRNAKDGEKLVLIDDKEVELNENDIVIMSNDVPVALAGAMGGKNTEIDENTKRVILESASFSLFNLRKTQMTHGIFSEAITRFTKGQPAGQTMPVALEFARRIGFLAPAAAFDSQKATPKPIEVSVTLEHVNRLLGTNFTAKQVEKTLSNVEFGVELDGSTVKCVVPFWRTDIHIPEDIIEEIGRLNGYDNISPILPLHATSDPNQLMRIKTAIRDHLAARGANEVLTYSFVHGDLLRKVGQNPDNSYRIVNSISPDLQYIRQSIAPSLLDKCYANLRGGYAKFALFEMNQTYAKSRGVDVDNVPNNMHQLGFVLVDKDSESNYYLAKKYLESLLNNLGIEFKIKPFVAEKDSSNAYYEPKRSAQVESNGEVIGYIGEIKASVLKGFKLPLGTAVFELKTEKMLKYKHDTVKKNFKLSQFPFVSRDITISVAGAVAYTDIESKLRNILNERGLIYKIAPTSIYQAEGEDKKNLSFHLEFSDSNKTLTKNEIQDIMEKLEAVK